MKRIKKVEESSALIGKVFDTFETDSHQDAPSIYAVRNAISNPNLLINGDFQIWQRGEIFSACQNDKYYPDRWQYFADNITSCTMNKVEDGLSFISTKNEGGWAIIYQPMEAELFNKIKGKTVTQSWLENGVLLEKTFTIPEIWARDIVNIPIARTDSTIIQNVKLELGTIATPFVPRPYAEELGLCKRYYRCCVVEGQWYIISSGVTHYSCYLDIGIMRVKPTIVNKEVRFVNVGKVDLTKLTIGNIAFDASITKTMHFTELIYNEVVQHKNNIIVKAELDAEIR